MVPEASPMRPRTRARSLAKDLVHAGVSIRSKSDVRLKRYIYIEALDTSALLR